MAVRLPRLLDSGMKELARLNPVSMALDENLAPLSTAEMVLPEGECPAETGQFVELYTSHGSAGIFRVQQSEQDYGGRVTLALEHGLTTLGDAIMPGEGEQSGTAKQLVSAILAHQPKTMWKLGRVDVPSSRTLTWKNDNANLLESLCNLMDELQGYRLTFDQNVFPWVMNIAALSDADGCECRLSRNLSSLRVEEDRSELCTRLYVSGLSSPLDADTIGTFGVVTRYMDADPDVGETELKKQGKAFLEAHKEPAVSVTMDAVDWYESTGEPFDRFMLGKVCRVCLPDYGRTIRQRVIALSWPDVYGQPDQVTVKLAGESTTAVDVMAGLIIDTTITKKRFTSDMRSQKELLLAAEEKITLMSTRIELIAKEVEVNAEQIALKASAEEVGELTRRMDAAEIAIDGANAAIALKASQTDVDSLGERVSSAEIAIDGANAEIALKVSKDGIVSAINMSTEGIKIKASRVEIDGETIVGWLSGTTIDVSHVNTASIDVADEITADTATVGVLDCTDLLIGGEEVTSHSQTVVTGQQTLTPTYVTIEYKDHDGANKYLQVVKAVTINNAATTTISYLGL